MALQRDGLSRDVHVGTDTETGTGNTQARKDTETSMVQVETDGDADGVCPARRAHELPAPPELTCGWGEQPEERHKGAEARVGASMLRTWPGRWQGVRGMVGRPTLSGRGACPLRSVDPLLKVLSKVLEGFRLKPCGQCVHWKDPSGSCGKTEWRWRVGRRAGWTSSVEQEPRGRRDRRCT